MKRKSSAIAVPVKVQPHEETYRYMACDLGNAYSNIKSDNGVAVDWRSITAPLSKSTRLADWPIDHVVKYKDEWWAAGEICYTLAPGTIEENLNMNRYVSEWYKRLFAFALHKAFYKLAGHEVIYPRVISSIPAVLFKMQDQVKKVQENLIGDYEIGNVFGGTLMVTVPKVILLPEGIGTYFGYLFGPGNNSQYQAGTWMIADFGYLTLDAVFVQDGEYIADMAKSDSQTGMSTVAEQIQEFVYSKTGVELDRAQADKAMECDIIEVNTKKINISVVRETALARLGKRATQFIEEWSRRANLSGVIITGGGAKYAYSHIASDVLPPLSQASNPRRANADGAYLYITTE